MEESINNGKNAYTQKIDSFMLGQNVNAINQVEEEKIEVQEQNHDDSCELSDADINEGIQGQAPIQKISWQSKLILEKKDNLMTKVELLMRDQGFTDQESKLKINKFINDLLNIPPEDIIPDPPEYKATSDKHSQTPQEWLTELSD